VLSRKIREEHQESGYDCNNKNKNKNKNKTNMAPPSEEEKVFLEAISILTEPQQALLITLYRDLGQKHLFDEEFFNGAAPPSQRRQLAAQLLSLDHEYTNGGLEGYITKARQLLADSQRGVNPLAGWTPSVPKGQLLDLGTTQYKEREEEGIKHLGSCGFVLVAGGLGERLGYTGIKVRSAAAGGSPY
jgi:UDP-sugar pyrophosphorylase